MKKDIFSTYVGKTIMIQSIDKLISIIFIAKYGYMFFKDQNNDITFNIFKSNLFTR